MEHRRSHDKKTRTRRIHREMPARYHSTLRNQVSSERALCYGRIRHLQERPKPLRGGIVILIKRTLEHHQLPRLDPRSHTDVSGIEESTTNFRNIRIFSVYTNTHDLIGDFNSKFRQWNSRITNRNGRRQEVYRENRPEVTTLGLAVYTYCPYPKTKDRMSWT